MAAKISVKMTGVSELIKELQARKPKGKKKVQLQVGYSAPYAIYVHEDLSMNHPNGGQAKFLEQPARMYVNEMKEIIKRAVRNRDGLEEAILRAGRFLLKMSKPLVPVDTGLLRDSGFVKVVERQSGNIVG